MKFKYEKTFLMRSRAVQFLNEIKAAGHECQMTYWDDSFGTRTYYVKWNIKGEEQ